MPGARTRRSVSSGPLACLGNARTIVETMKEEDGFEAWREIIKQCEPDLPLRKQAIMQELIVWRRPVRPLSKPHAMSVLISFLDDQTRKFTQAYAARGGIPHKRGRNLEGRRRLRVWWASLRQRMPAHEPAGQRLFPEQLVAGWRRGPATSGPFGLQQGPEDAQRRGRH